MFNEQGPMNVQFGMILYIYFLKYAKLNFIKIAVEKADTFP